MLQGGWGAGKQTFEGEACGFDGKLDELMLDGVIVEGQIWVTGTNCNNAKDKTNIRRLMIRMWDSRARQRCPLYVR